MATWSAENATKAFLRTLKSTKTNTIEPNMSEFLSALAAGNGARLMVEICHTSASSITHGLIAAARQTSGRVICILPNNQNLYTSKHSLATNVEAGLVELVVSDIDKACQLLMSDYRAADFVVVDCQLESYEKVFCVAQGCRGGVVIGCNALLGRNLELGEGQGMMGVELLPIGGGIRVWRRVGSQRTRKSQWVVSVDECTGEQNVFRIVSPRRKWIKA